jgi:hypothetical protein
MFGRYWIGVLYLTQRKTENMTTTNELLRRIGTQLHNDRVENTDMVQYPLQGKGLLVQAIYDSMEDIDKLLGWS